MFLLLRMRALEGTLNGFGTSVQAGAAADRSAMQCFERTDHPHLGNNVS
jgi:hypothetical protein